MTNLYQLIVDEENDGNRLDKTLVTLTESIFSRSFLQKIIKDGEVYIDGKPRKASFIVSEGEQISFRIPEIKTASIEPEIIPLDVLYEDGDVIVINKPKGMVVHPANGHNNGTLVNALMYHCGDSLSGINGVLRPGIVHRIDMDTTGSIIACKNDKAHINIAAQLKEHSLNRTYRAIVHGIIKEDELTIDKPIGRSVRDRKIMAITEDGRRAVTHIKVLERFKEYTYIECRLETGRTHQIRVHMRSIGHPIAGDEVYSNASCRFKTHGQCLHAYKLGFIHPTTGEYIETVAPIPEYMEKILSIIQ